MTYPETAILIDAGFFGKLCEHFQEDPKKKYLKVDLEEFGKYLSIKQGFSCKEIFYYTAPPFQSVPPTPEEKKRKAGYDKFISEMGQSHIVKVREGRLQKIDGNFIQKGVDTLVTMDLMELGLSKRYPSIILVACDTDFVPIIEKIRELGVEVILYYYTDKVRKSKFSLSNHLIQACPKRELLTKEHFIRNLRKS